MCSLRRLFHDEGCLQLVGDDFLAGLPSDTVVLRHLDHDLVQALDDILELVCIGSVLATARMSVWRGKRRRGAGLTFDFVDALQACSLGACHRHGCCLGSEVG